MTAAINALLKLSVIVALLVASAGVAYYYTVYLPDRDTRLDQERALAQARADEDKRASEQQLALEQHQAEERRAEAKAGAESRYQTCIARASAAHELSWAVACKQLAEKTAQGHADCLATAKLSQHYCDTVYPTRDASPNCALPVKVSTVIDDGLIKARNRCAEERNAALQ